MDDEFEAVLAGVLGPIGSIAPFAGLTVPTSLDGVLQLTVGNFLDIIDAVEVAFVDVRPVLQAQLNSPQFTANLPPEALSALQDIASGNTDLITAGFDTIRAELSGVPRSTLLVDASNTGGGGSVSDEIAQAFLDAQLRLADLLWDSNAGLFTSPTFSIDPDTGNWFSLDGVTPAFSGDSIASLWSLVGEAAGNAILSYFSSQATLLQQLIDGGATANSFAAASTAVETAAAVALENLQSFGAEVTGPGNANLAQIETDGLAQYQAVVNAIVANLPALSSEISQLILGSRNSDPTFVVNLDGTVQGSVEGDWFYLNDQDNVFDGGVGSDLVFGQGGNDRLTGGADDDTLLGGAGDADVSVYSSARGNYTVQISADGTAVVSDRSDGGDGTDTLTGIEFLEFAGEDTFNLSRQTGIASLSEADIGTFVELYIAYFNRAPDAIGLNFWGSAFANGFTLETIASQFLDQPETQAAYPASATNLDFATQVYGNVLGRLPDQDGLDFWVRALDSGGVTRDQFILEVLRGAKADPAPDAEQAFIDLQLADRAYLADKTDIGTLYAVIRGLSDTTDAAAVMNAYVRGDESSIQAAIDATDQAFGDATAANGGELLIQLVGVIGDPFATDIAVA
ncbi:DUF4214 domain-containing protein [Marivita sp. S6314]|uniref:DUF4214 domain-containing protein n=1 Tax=Marivita sp. S6314 TaxID=2926406 RepID=UPI001FF5F26A|nr:DUF4214 domain-containing protein [Marivita sp. S6314]MCK0149277.1 DUF4214 domain-containing protein [Marivita sp. S6314]